MEDSLFALCRICNINEAKYTCPRCSIQTCSLPCSRRHKLWASCSGIRDPTVFKPKSQLATPSGIDHDYNFLHSIEHRIERSEKLIIEERGLVAKDELELARAGEGDHNRSRRKDGPQRSGEEPIERSLKRTRTTIQRAPKGMRRNLENETTWCKKRKTIHWQVEWIRDGDAGRILGKAKGNSAIGEVYAAIMEEERIRKLSDEERRMLKKRKGGGVRQRIANRKKRRADVSEDLGGLTLSALQDPETGTWSIPPVTALTTDLAEEALNSTNPEFALPPSYHLYLLRPHTEAIYPKVLVPIDPKQSLEVILQRRVVLEFPTIYVICSAELPDKFMLERDYLLATGKGSVEASGNESQQESSEEKSDSRTSRRGSITSTSGSDSDEEMEDGEVVPAVWGGSR